MKNNITAIIIAKNEEKMLASCLETLDWCQNLILLDNGSTDKTVEIAEKYNCQVISFQDPSFAKKRERALSLVKTDWLIYVDADERVSPALAKEILVHLENEDASVMSFYRQNICYGYEMKNGGWDEDLVTRVFKKDSLKEWIGEIHESPVFEGENIILKQKLLHLTHRSTADNLKKSSEWTIKEAELLAAANIKEVTLKTIIRKGLMEFYRRAYKKNGRQDGMPGLIEALVQALNRMMVYIQVWELQQKPSIEKRYQKEEEKMKALWKSEGFKK
jgi:glycosyltransferase involved in cell wall biosynthesis